MAHPVEFGQGFDIQMISRYPNVQMDGGGKSGCLETAHPLQALLLGSNQSISALILIWSGGRNVGAGGGRVGVGSFKLPSNDFICRSA